MWDGELTHYASMLKTMPNERGQKNRALYRLLFSEQRVVQVCTGDNGEKQ
jgi:hypothetical protein